MKINELQPKQGKVEIEATVINKSSVREFRKENFAGRVCNARIKDDTGEVELTLWNEQIEQVDEGDTIKIINGYVGEWQGEMQLSTGRFGKLEIIKKAEKKEPEKKEQQLRTNITPQTSIGNPEEDFFEETEGSNNDIHVEEEEI